MQWIVKKTLDKIEEINDNKYYSKLKGNQKILLKKAVNIANTKTPTDTYISELRKEGKYLVKRKILTFTKDCCFYHNKMTHIETR